LAVSSEKRRKYIHVGSAAASVPPTFSPETANISNLAPYLQNTE